jgi:hypothetical protein
MIPSPINLTTSPLNRVPHLRRSFIASKVGIVRSTTAPAHLHAAEISQVEAKP